MKALLSSPLPRFWYTAVLVVVISQLARGIFLQWAVFNSGIAFNLTPPLFVTYILSGVLILAIAIWFYLTQRFGLLWAVALGLIFGGGASNLLDRLFHNGLVADYIHFGSLGTINLADAAISAGILLAVLYLNYEKS